MTVVLGLIPLPLSAYHAKAIAGFASRVLPPQHGPPVNTHTRRIWDLPRSAFELINPAWNEQLGQILANVVKDLGIKTKVHVELLKLSMLGTVAVSDYSRPNSNRKPGVFGNLVVYLPSQHEAGF